jgi:hypothetical protein
MKNQMLLLFFKFVTLSFFLALLFSCKSTTPLKNAQDYCLANDPELFKECVRYRKDYLNEKQKIITQFNDNQQQCDYYAIQKSGAKNSQCTNNNIVKTASTAVSSGNNVKQNCDLQTNSVSRSSVSTIHQTRIDMKKENIAKQCMKDFGWKNIRSYRAELKVLKQKFGYADL